MSILLADLRLLFIVLSALVFVFMLIRLVQFHRDMSWAQRLFIIGNMCMLAYAADVHREAYLEGTEWRWRLVTFTVGIVCYGAYVLEPASAQRKYFTKKTWFHRDEKDSSE